MSWEVISELIKPELFLLVPFCWVLGLFLKNTEKFQDKRIPSVLWGIGVLFSFLYLQFMIEGDYELPQRIIAAFVDGTFIAGLAVFGSQQVKQLQKKGE
jgi:hypothetical protein